MSLKRKAADAVTSEAKKAKAGANSSITHFFGAPKVIPKTKASIAAAEFNKDDWVKTLTEEQKQLLTLEINTLDESWLAHLKDELVTTQFLDLKRFLKKEVLSGKKVFPPSADVYSWSRLTPLDKVKVVIIGQDPYHNQNQAHGLCFSVRPPTPAPPSLGNIYKSLTNDYPDFVPPPNKSGLLTPWAERGVLMLNTSLTVEAHKPASHSGKGWERLTQKVIDVVNKERRGGVVFLAWGKHAQDRMKGIDKAKHYVLQSAHPSPFSARNGFLDNGHFKKTNEWLETKYGAEGIIDWNLTVDLEKADADVNPAKEH
ncbi:uracil-DNA glycosylase [Microthyrium microscopicum]|uniref:Uracil-DNA glycosylase n=1 Tax=Microthyrium microscopicum TaxID=703497 RepID=A0A6A6U5V2_9PEZI|nr:uracil-DNA glycosylase [Microthyrium microscopicum]